MKIRISESAYRDLANGFSFYNFQVAGLGHYFHDSLFSDIESLRIYAGIHPIHLGKHRMLAKRFPYAVYYVIKDNSVIVSAVLDCRRNPGWIENRINTDDE